LIKKHEDKKKDKTKEKEETNANPTGGKIFFPLRPRCTFSTFMDCVLREKNTARGK
jgi:hypothetical protein